MAHTLTWLKSDQFVEVTLSGDITNEDVLFLKELHLSSRLNPLFVIVDASKVGLAVPPNAVSLAKQTEMEHPMVGHISVFGVAVILQLFATMMAKLSRQNNKVSFFPTREQALAHIGSLMP